MARKGGRSHGGRQRRNVLQGDVAGSLRREVRGVLAEHVGDERAPPLDFPLAPPAHCDGRRVELAFLRAVVLPPAVGPPALAGDDAGLAPGKVVKVPERVERQHEVPDGQADQVHQHPEYVLQLERRREDEHGWQPENDRRHEQRHHLDRPGRRDQCGRQREGHHDRDGEKHRPEQLHEDHELHGKAGNPAQVFYQHELQQVVHCRVNPAPPLRQQNPESARHHRLALGLRHEHHLPLREVAQHQRRQKPVLAQQKQVFLVQRFHLVLAVLLDDVRVRENGNPSAVLARLDSVHRKAPGKARHSAEDGFEGFAEMVRDVILEY
ncbi:MAG: hypothetical protein BJ554DRAFT_6065 [Olpidium bornovanus]|uniref:Uncharacterized protein n=1 Tax=Olpidium bornovanus TaxID=278681 RepID=A0A8H8DKB0_9FUNG|nr:MAG: hypothetical protein BJ554DRAFT_6065 [Olpidium bornovanus]